MAFFHTLTFIFTYGFLTKISRTHFCFDGQFLRYFHGRKNNFTNEKSKIAENFHGRDFDFHGEENADFEYIIKLRLFYGTNVGKKYQ